MKNTTYDRMFKKAVAVYNEIGEEAFKKEFLFMLRKLIDSPYKNIKIIGDSIQNNGVFLEFESKKTPVNNQTVTFSGYFSNWLPQGSRLVDILTCEFSIINMLGEFYISSNLPVICFKDDEISHLDFTDLFNQTRLLTNEMERSMNMYGIFIVFFLFIIEASLDASFLLIKII